VDIDKQQISHSRGVTAFGSDGYQQIYSQYNSSFSFVSSLISYKVSISLPIQQAVDSCWTSGNIFRLGLNKVLKTDYQGEIIANLSVSSPKSLSVIQLVVPMADSNPTDDECLGCWIVVDGHTLLKIDSNLEIQKTVSRLVSATLVCSNHSNSGCYVVDNGVARKIIDIIESEKAIK